MNHDKLFVEVKYAVMIINQVIAGTGNYEVEEFHEYTKDNLLAHPFDQTPASESINPDCVEKALSTSEAMLAINKHIDDIVKDGCNVGAQEMNEWLINWRNKLPFFSIESEPVIKEDFKAVKVRLGKDLKERYKFVSNAGQKRAIDKITFEINNYSNIGELNVIKDFVNIWHTQLHPAQETLHEEDDCGRAKAMLAIIEIRRYIDGLIHDECDVGIDEMREEFWKFVYILNMNNESMPEPEIGVDVLKDLFKEYLKTLNKGNIGNTEWREARRELVAFLAWFGREKDQSYKEMLAESKEYAEMNQEIIITLCEYANLNSEGSE